MKRPVINASVHLIVAVGFFLFEPRLCLQSAVVPAKRHAVSAVFAANGTTTQSHTTAGVLIDENNLAVQPCRSRSSDPVTQPPNESIVVLRIGSDEFGVDIPSKPHEDLRAYVLEDLSRTLSRGVGAEVTTINENVTSADGEQTTVRGQLTIKTLPRDFQAYAVADRLRKVTKSDGCWEIVVPSSLIQRYRNAHKFWNDHSEKRKALHSFMDAFKALAAKSELTRNELGALLSDSSSLLDHAKSNPLASIQILEPSPLAYELIDHGDGSAPEVRVGVPFIREGEMGLLLLAFDGSRWIIIPID